MSKLIYCSFCGKSQHELQAMIQGQDVCICDECVDICFGIMRTEGHSKHCAERDALVKIIEMNRQHAEDQYGDADKAESWSCVTVAREGLKGAKP